ncbi:MAG: hypothetical protein ACRDVP_09500 [Acidimicrobiales bacterium]
MLPSHRADAKPHSATLHLGTDGTRGRRALDPSRNPRPARECTDAEHGSARPRMLAGPVGHGRAFFVILMRSEHRFSWGVGRKDDKPLVGGHHHGCHSLFVT